MFLFEGSEFMFLNRNRAMGLQSWLQRQKQLTDLVKLILVFVNLREVLGK